MFRRHKAGSVGSIPSNDDEDEEEDVFSILSKRRGKKKAKIKHDTKTQDDATATTQNLSTASANKKDSNFSSTMSLSSTDRNNNDTSSSLSGKEHHQPTEPLIAATTSSMKRHHKEMSDTRKAKMDSMLAQLQYETASTMTKKKSSPTTTANPSHRGIETSRPSKSRGGGGGSGGGGGGSYVEPGQEHLTTNIFVGNLAPNITEEELTRLFGQFGELYSVKIMWPRTAEERTRQRLTGFVCFYDRSDAEDAMEACCEVDSFGNGRRLMLRWGKNVIREKQRQVQHPPPKPQGEGGVMKQSDQTSIEAPRENEQRHHHNTSGLLQTDRTEESLNGRPRIQVEIPPNPRRARFISLVASFVAKDGTDLEQALLNDARNGAINHDMQFLTFRPQQNNKEHIFYKWRVYSYVQGDGDCRWRTKPFVMMSTAQGDCCLWVPPPMDLEAARQEAAALQRQKEEEEKRREERRRRQRCTGPQDRKAKQFQQQQRPLSQMELDEFHSLTRKKLCASREAIAAAMSFCFEKCAVAASQICQLLRELLVETARGVSVESRIARLFLLSDILFNSQQPGVRNAFYFRDAIEQWAPEVFASLGCDRLSSRVTHHRIQKAVSATLAAWTNWSVYNPNFLDELQAKFEGRSIEALVKKEDEDMEKTNNESKEQDTEVDVATQVASTDPVGDWKEVNDDLAHAVEEEEEEEAYSYESARKTGAVDTDKGHTNAVEDTAQFDDGFEEDAHERMLAKKSDVAVVDQFEDADGELLVQCDVTNAANNKNHALSDKRSEDIDKIDCIKLQPENDDDDVDGESLDDEELADDCDGEPLCDEEDSDAGGHRFTGHEAIRDNDDIGEEPMHPS